MPRRHYKQEAQIKQRCMLSTFDNEGYYTCLLEMNDNKEDVLIKEMLAKMTYMKLYSESFDKERLENVKDLC